MQPDHGTQKEAGQLRQLACAPEGIEWPKDGGMHPKELGVIEGDHLAHQIKGLTTLNLV